MPFLHRRQRYLAEDSFTPAELAGLQLWLKADAGLGLPDNTAVATWLDQSGNARTASQATGSVQPIYFDAGLGGKPAVRFDATNDNMTFPTYVAPRGITVIVCWATTHTVAGDRRLLQGVTNNWLLGPRAGKVQHYGGAFIDHGACISGEVVVQSVVESATSTTGYRNGGAGITVAMSTAIGQFNLGFNSTFVEPAAADLMELIIYDRTLPDGERVAVERYLRRWGAVVA